VGIDAAKAKEIVDAAGFDETPTSPPQRHEKLWNVYQAEDATLVEVNPLVKTEDGEIVALDGKVSIDEQLRLPSPRARGPRRPLGGDRPAGGARDRAMDLNYVKLDGNVGIIGNGAGLVMSTLDVVAYAGEEFTMADGTHPKPANFLDIGGGANAEVMANGLDIIFKTRRSRPSSSTSSAASPRVTRSPTASSRPTTFSPGHGKSPKPLVVRLDGNNAEKGRRDPRRAPSCRSWSASTPWTARPAASPSSPPSTDRPDEDKD
jgi:succinyl-CoA synthetase beta subunit